MSTQGLACKEHNLRCDVGANIGGVTCTHSQTYQVNYYCTGEVNLQQSMHSLIFFFLLHGFFEVALYIANLPGTVVTGLIMIKDIIVIIDEGRNLLYVLFLLHTESYRAAPLQK